MEYIKIEKYYTENDNKEKFYDIESIREEFEREVEKLENHNETIEI